MEWVKIWRTVFCGWDGDVDLAMLADELHGRGHVNGGEDRDAMAWVRRQIQEAY